jgi:hypothetical protein
MLLGLELKSHGPPSVCRFVNVWPMLMASCELFDDGAIFRLSHAGAAVSWGLFF